jgi:hypothetical protein
LAPLDVIPAGHSSLAARHSPSATQIMKHGVTGNPSTCDFAFKHPFLAVFVRIADAPPGVPLTR